MAKATVDKITWRANRPIPAGRAASPGSCRIPAAAEILKREHPGLELTLIDTHPPEALELLRAGHVDLALIFRHDESPPEDEGVRLIHLLDDPTYLLTTSGATDVADHRESTWIAGCERCRAHLVEECARGLLPANRLHDRRHGAHAGAGCRRDGRHHHPRARAAVAPSPRHHRNRDPRIPATRLRRHLRHAARPTATVALLAALHQAV